MEIAEKVLCLLVCKQAGFRYQLYRSDFGM